MSALLLAARSASRRLVGVARPLYQAEGLRCFSAAPAQQDDDLVLDAFKEYQEQYQTLIKESAKIPVPLNGDDAAVRQYAEQMESLKRKIGMPDSAEVLEAVLDYKLESSQGNIAKFLNDALEGEELGDLDVVPQEITAAVAEVEEKVGALDEGNEQAWTALHTRLADISKKHGLDDLEKIKAEAKIDVYKTLLGELRQKALEDMEKAKQRDGLDWVKVDVKELHPKMQEVL